MDPGFLGQTAAQLNAARRAHSNSAYLLQSLGLYATFYSSQTGSKGPVKDEAEVTRTDGIGWYRMGLLNFFNS